MINIDIDNIYNFLKQFNKDNYIDLFKKRINTTNISVKNIYTYFKRIC